MKIFLLSILVMHTMQSWTKPYYLIIHGTWCRPFDWHMPGGNFYDALTQVIDPSSVSFFLWSASNSHKARLKAAQQLVDYIALSIPTHCELNIIAHSHGCNVGFLASQIMAQNSNNTIYIAHFYALGAPIDRYNYMPAMSVIERVYNLFSFNDFVQPVLGLFEREFLYHPGIANLVVMLDGKEPTHAELHSPIIAHWLPYLPSLVHNQPLNNNCTTIPQPGILQFWTDKEPTYAIDTDRKKRHNRDFKILAHLNTMIQNIKTTNFTRQNYFSMFIRKIIPILPSQRVNQTV